MMKLQMHSSHKQHGLTLVEIMVSITISLILLAGVVKIFQSAKQSYNIQQALSRIQENARLMTDVMIRDITTSGYLGCLGSTNEVVNTLQDQTTNYDFATAIEGNEGDSDPDSIIIRRVSEATAIPVSEPMTNLQSPLTLDSDHMNYDSLQQWDVVTVSDCAGAAVFMITNDPDTDGVIEHAASVTATGGANTGQSNSTDDLERIFGSQSASTAKIYRVGTTSYQVQPSSSGRATNSLFVTPGGELVEGVEDLQIQYGLGSTPPNATTPAIAEQYVDADQVTDWNDVVSIRLTFVINSVDMVVNPGDGDGLLRKTFTSTVRLRNRAPA